MSDVESDTRPFKRLSKNVVPINYELTVFPNFETSTFSGSVRIEINICNETDFIEIHSLDLNLSNITFKSGDTVLKNSKLINVKNCESVDIYFLQKLPSGRGFLNIDFNGVLNDNLVGFYKTKCLKENGESCIAAVTQFEAAYARKAFPCFDEPCFKATFDICIIAEPSKTVLSNMPLRSIVPYENDERFKNFQFERSVIMSTYLVSYVIGHYEHLETVDELGTLIKLYTPIGKTDLGKFSLDIAVKAVPFFTKFFGIEYPLPKLDLIGLNDVEIG
ncbi:unnamed protein product [Brachionus calyciflorus]|uniref:Aminopeptidase N-like N-terminal domain-containing protein n=1 Tax=Brachionus calyciflorus TaxID=104777 RepID=A0A814CE12_9BILA|nr:unnamed protein product [Brachionus calyciflorus]